MEESQDFGDLRALCHRCSSDAFTQVTTWLAKSEAEQPGIYRSQWSDYVSRALESWPARYKHIRVASIADRDHELTRAPWMELVTSVTLAELDLSDAAVTDWLVSSLREHFPSLEALTISGPHSRAKELRKLTDEGFFDDLKSLYFQGYSLHPTAIEVIASTILSRASDLTTLGLVDCDITDNKLRALFDSPHLAQVEHLDFSRNVSFEKRLPAYLASQAAKFERLTHITMRDVEPRQIGLRKLLGADWPAGLKKLVLTPHRLSTKHIALLDKLGKLDMIVSDEPGQSMMLSWNTDQKAFDMMCRARLFSNVAHLECTRDTVEDFSALTGQDVTLQSLRIIRKPQRTRPIEWETLEGCTRGDELELIAFEGASPDSSWFHRLLEHGGSGLEHVQAKFRIEPDLLAYMLDHDVFDRITWSGAYILIDMLDVDNQMLIQRATYKPEKLEEARATLTHIDPLLWKLWDDPNFELVRSEVYDPKYSIRFEGIAT